MIRFTKISEQVFERKPIRCITCKEYFIPLGGTVVVLYAQDKDGMQYDEGEVCPHCVWLKPERVSEGIKAKRERFIPIEAIDQQLEYSRLDSFAQSIREITTWVTARELALAEFGQEGIEKPSEGDIFKRILKYQDSKSDYYPQNA